MVILLTPWGWLYCFFLILLSAAAYNNGSNLVFLCLAVMVAFLLISLPLGIMNVLNLVIKRKLIRKGRLYCEQEIPVLLSVNRFYPGFQLNFKELVDPLFIQVKSSESAPFFADNTEIELSLEFSFRGRFQLEKMEVQSQFPFALFNFKRTYTPQPLSIDCYPIAYSLESSRVFSRVPEGLIARKTRQTRLAPDEYSGETRSWQMGDPLKDIHWKMTARFNEIVVRKKASEQKRKIYLFFHHGSRESGSFDYHLETALKGLMSLASHFLAQGFQIAMLQAAAANDMPPRQTAIYEKRDLEEFCFHFEPDGDQGEFIQKGLALLPPLAAGIFLTLRMDEESLPRFIKASQANPHLAVFQVVSSEKGQARGRGEYLLKILGKIGGREKRLRFDRESHTLIPESETDRSPGHVD